MASHCANVFTRPTRAAPGRGLCPSEHRQTELVRPGDNILDVGDGIRPLVIGVPPSASTRDYGTVPRSHLVTFTCQ